ncbi:MAG: alpha/beta hydrolase [Treponema sp.]|nr:alpha/beta hydrolase [Treponema sp.]
MKKNIQIEAEDLLIAMADGIVYAQRPDFCDITFRQLRLSLLKPRTYFDYDKRVIWPVIVFICGGGFTEMDRNAWVPELSWFAKRGYVVASVDYTTRTRSRFPEQLIDIKEAIRFLRAHAAEFGLDPARFAVMGESAGGYLSAITGVTGKTREFDTGGNLEQSSEVQAAIPWYPPVNLGGIKFEDFMLPILPQGLKDYPNILDFVHKEAPPYMILHGTADTQVPVSESEALYDALQKAGVDADLIIFEGVEHAEAHFVQPQVKQMMLDFLNRHLK